MPTWSLTKPELRKALRETSSTDFCRNHVFDDDTWLFDNAEELGIVGSYTDFRKQLGSAIQVPAKDIAIVGSAKLGYSLNPEPRGDLFKQFGDHSDIDTVIVSANLFDEIWTQFKEAFFNGYTNLAEEHAKELFKGFIVLASATKYNTKYLRELSAKMLEVRRTLQKKLRLDYPIRYRIYSRWSDVTLYHAWSIERLRERLRQ